METIKHMDEMKTYTSKLVVPTALTICLTFMSTAIAEAPILQINSKFQPDPLIVHGTSGGAKTSNCGNISATPNQIIQVKESLPYLHLSVQSEGQPTLLIEGPNGRFCVLGDASIGGRPEISGYWQSGNYSLYIGDRTDAQHPYTLSISEKHSP